MEVSAPHSPSPSASDQSRRASRDSPRDHSGVGSVPQQRIRAGLLSRAASDSADKDASAVTPSDEDEAHMSDTGQIPRRFSPTQTYSPTSGPGRNGPSRSAFSATASPLSPSPLSSPADSIHLRSDRSSGQHSARPSDPTGSVYSSTSSLISSPGIRPGEGNHPYSFSGDGDQSDASAHSGGQYANDNLSRAKSVSSVSSANSTSSLEAAPFRAAPLGNVRAGYKGYGRPGQIGMMSQHGQEGSSSSGGPSSDGKDPLSPSRQRVMPKPSSDLWQYRNAPGMGGRREGRPLPGSYANAGPSTAAYAPVNSSAFGHNLSLSPSRRTGSTIRSKIVKSANKLGLKPLTALPLAQPSDSFINTRSPTVNEDVTSDASLSAQQGGSSDAGPVFVASVKGFGSELPLKLDGRSVKLSPEDAGTIRAFATSENSSMLGSPKTSSLLVPTSPLLSSLSFVPPGKSATPPPMARTSSVTNAPLFVVKQPSSQSFAGVPGTSPLPSPSVLPRAGYAFGKWARGVPSPGTDVMRSPVLKCSPRQERDAEDLENLAPLDERGSPPALVVHDSTVADELAPDPEHVDLDPPGSSLHALPPTPNGSTLAASLKEGSVDMPIFTTPTQPRSYVLDDIVGRSRSLSPSRPTASLPPSPRLAQPDVARTPAQQVRLEARAGRARAPSEPSGPTPGPTPGVEVTGLPSSEGIPTSLSRSHLGAHQRSLSYQPSGSSTQQASSSSHHARGISRLASEAATSSRGSVGSSGGSGGSGQTVMKPVEDRNTSSRGRRTPRPSLLRAITSEGVFNLTNSSGPNSPNRLSSSEKQGSWGRRSRPSTSPSSPASSSGGETVPSETFPIQRLLPVSLGGRRKSRSGSVSSTKGVASLGAVDDRSAKSSPSSPTDGSFRIKWPASLTRDAQIGSLVGQVSESDRLGKASDATLPVQVRDLASADQEAAIQSTFGSTQASRSTEKQSPGQALPRSSDALPPVSEIPDTASSPPDHSTERLESPSQSLRPKLAALQQMPNDNETDLQDPATLQSNPARLPSVAVSESESLAPVSFRDAPPAIAGKSLPVFGSATATLKPLSPIPDSRSPLSDSSRAPTSNGLDGANAEQSAPPVAPSSPIARSASPAISGSASSRSTRGPRDFEFGEILGEGSYSTVIEAWDLVSGPSRDDPKSAPTQTISAAAAVAGASAKASALSIAARQGRKAYAVKVLDKVHILKERKHKYVTVEKEALSLLIRHPGIVTLYWTFQDRESLYFVLELAQNGELLSFIKKFGSFDTPSARFYSAQLLEAIHAMHKVGVIHRDIKPENVLLDSALRVKVTDFGSAKIVRPDATPPTESAASVAATPTREKTNSFVGTAEYVSPELLGGNSATASSDFWAFGCVLFQIIAGRPPFKGPNEYQTFQKILKRDFQYSEGFPEDARDLVDQLLVLDPLLRLGSGPSGAAEIKAHPFFEGIQWETLWTITPPPMQTGIFSRPPTAANLERHFEDMSFDFRDSDAEGDNRQESWVSDSANLTDEEMAEYNARASGDDSAPDERQTHLRRASSVSDSPGDGKSSPSQADDADDSDSSVDGDGENEGSGVRPRGMSTGGMGKRSGNLLRFAAAAVTGREWSGSAGPRGKSTASRRGSTSQPPTTLRQIQRRFSSSGPTANASTSSVDDPDAESGGLNKRKSTGVLPVTSIATSSWAGLLLPHEVLLYSCPVVHRKTGTANMFSKRRQLLLTDFPRLLCVKETAAALKVKSEVILAIPGVDARSVLGTSTSNSIGTDGTPAEDPDHAAAPSPRPPFSVPMRRGSTTDTIFNLNSHIRAESLSVPAQRPDSSRSISGNAAEADESPRPPALMPSWARPDSRASGSEHHQHMTRRSSAGEEAFPRSSTVRPPAPSQATTAAATPNLLTGLELKPGGRVFVVETPSREYVYEDLAGDASHWVRSIMSAAKGSGPSDGPYISHV